MSSNSESQKPTEREVIDPVSHLPVQIHDNTSGELDKVSPLSFSDSEENSPLIDNAMKALLQEEANSPGWADYASRKLRVQATYNSAVAAMIGSSATVALSFLSTGSFGAKKLLLGSFICCCSAAVAGACAVYFGVSKPVEQDKSQNASEESDKQSNVKTPESASWLNFILRSVWPIVNPSLFISVSDMLEDSLQASLPTLIKGVRVADIGQGSQPLRILGIRGMHPGDAAVDKGGLKGEEGDFTNLEVSVGYRARPTGNNLKERSSNIHLLIQLYTTGNLMIPIWVEIDGIIATARIRLQLTPNPPFVSTMTMTFLGLPRVTLKCTPLHKGFFNLMDLPVLSHWIQAAIDSAIAEYVAPRSLNLDLKTLLTGREKMDTEALGVIIINVYGARDFRDGDGGKFWEKSKDQRGDGYVTLAWGKLGKPTWSTRIIENEGNPVWDEPAALLVTPADVNAQERLQLQLWDSDRFTADDLLGSVEVRLQDLMEGPDSLNKLSSREDGLTEEDGSPCPGTLLWSCGYFEKTALPHHLGDAAEVEKSIKEEAGRKLRETQAMKSGQNGEAQQQKAEEMKEKTDEIISGSPPSAEWPSGILSIRVVSISGLEVQKVRESGVKGGGDSEEGDDMPSSYCMIIINHEQVFRTRTKMKTSEPYFDAGTERFIKNWQETIVFVAVRDARVHENDALLGVIVLPLRDLFKDKSQTTDSFPLVGGVGYGRARLSILFRGVQTKLPGELQGWEMGTFEIQPQAHASDDLPDEVKACRLVLRTLYGKGKMIPKDGRWAQKHDTPLRLPVLKRFSSCLVIQFKKYSVGSDLTTAFCVLWLRHISDGEDVDLALPIRKYDKNTFARARFNAADDIGEPIGTLHMRVRMYPGLSGYHKNIADPDRTVKEVMEVLDCAEESEEIQQDVEYDKQGDTSSSSSDDDDNDGDLHKHGPLGEVRNYRARKEQLHRKHRGLMQWSGVRKLAWLGHDVEGKKDKAAHKVKSVFKHQDRHTGGVDKEV